MFINNSGEHIEGGKFQFLGQIAPDVPVTDITFSGLDGDADRVYALSFLWKNPLTGARKLMFQPNAESPAAGSSMQVHDFEITGLAGAESNDADFGLAVLTANTADRYVQGAAFFAAMQASADGSPVGRTFKGEGYCEDSAAVVGAQRHHYTRQGFWAEVATKMESLTIATNPTAAAIDAGSDFRLWKIL